MQYYSYNESKEYLRQFNIKSSFQFYRLVKEGSFDNKLNKRPYDYFNGKKRKDWISWEDFLSFSKEDEKNKKYVCFQEAREFCRNLKLKSQKDWNKWCKFNDLRKLKIPSNPNVIYKNKGWVSFSDWLGNTSYKNLMKIDYLKYDECKSYIKVNYPEIKNRVNWTSFDKSNLPLFIPKRPDYIYKKSGDWINWESFLDSDLSPRSKSKKIIDFDSAKKYVASFGFKDQYEFHNFLEEKKIDFIPKRPDYVYREYWKGYLDFLGCSGNKESIGERLIKTFLEENNVKFQKEKKFKTCRNIKELPFDFYLPEYNMCIEYDGELHYKSVSHLGGENQYIRQQKHDRIKNEWCEKNNIRLLRIPYLKKNKIFKILELELKSLDLYYGKKLQNQRLYTNT